MNIQSPYDLLLAYSNEVTFDFFEQKLIEDGFARVFTVESGQDALSRLQRNQFHAFVMAQKLKDIDCWRLARIIRSGRFCNADIPILVGLDYPSNHANLALAKEHRTTILSDDGIDHLHQIVVDSIKSRIMPSVLIVEDDLNAANAVRIVLSNYFDVEVHPDGKQGFHAWSQRRHDLVLLDVMLPGLSGPEVLQKILDVNPQQPIIIITAYATDECHQDLMMAGAIEFVDKPFDINALPHICDSALRRSNLMTSASEASRSANVMQELATRVHAADVNLDSGKPSAAAFHIKHALASIKNTTLSDDQWSELMNEFPDY